MKSETTKRALAKALRQLLQKKPINKITIHDITETCGISRMTFYYHFRDIYDLAEWTMRETLRPMLVNNLGAENWQQGFLAVLDALKENQALVQNVIHSVDRELIERYLRGQVTDLLMPVVKEKAEGVLISPAGMEQVAVFYTYAMMGVVMEWIERNMVTPPREVVSITAAILHGDLKHSLENMAMYERQKAGRNDYARLYTQTAMMHFSS